MITVNMIGQPCPIPVVEADEELSVFTGAAADKLAVGTIGNMLEIAEMVSSASRTITL